MVIFHHCKLFKILKWSAWGQDKYTYLDFSTIINLGIVLPAYMLNLGFCFIALQNPEIGVLERRQLLVKIN